MKIQMRQIQTFTTKQKYWQVKWDRYMLQGADWKRVAQLIKTKH